MLDPAQFFAGWRDRVGVEQAGSVFDVRGELFVPRRDRRPKRLLGVSLDRPRACNKGKNRYHWPPVPPSWAGRRVFMIHRAIAPLCPLAWAPPGAGGNPFHG